MIFIKKNFFILFLVTIFTASLLFYYCYVSTGFWEFSNSADDWAKFGSYAAGIFTGITFLAVIY